MANIAVKKTEGNGKRALEPVLEWPPIFRGLRDIFGWDPFREIERMIPRMALAEKEMFVPDFEVKETPEEFIFRADVPGIASKDIDISITANRLSVSGKREAEEKKEGETFYAYERSYGAFTRTFTLPDGVDADKLAAELKDGVLTLRLAKKPEAKPHKVEVKQGK